jgi:ribosomal protein S16
MINKLILRRAGRYKNPVYNIIVVNKRNSCVGKLGVLYLCKFLKRRKIQVNINLFFFWLLRGLKPSMLLMKFLNMFFSLIVKYLHD